MIIQKLFFSFSQNAFFISSKCSFHLFLCFIHSLHFSFSSHMLSSAEFKYVNEEFSWFKKSRILDRKIATKKSFRHYWLDFSSDFFHNWKRMQKRFIEEIMNIFSFSTFTSARNSITSKEINHRFTKSTFQQLMISFHKSKIFLINFNFHERHKRCDYYWNVQKSLIQVIYYKLHDRRF